jgi:hypothetical protein
MTTIILDEKTKAGRTLLDLATLLAKNEIQISIKKTVEDIVAFDVHGNPSDRQSYIDKVQAADVRISNGEFITVDDLKIEIASWK